MFCDQKKISGAQKPPDDLEKFLDEAAEGLSGRFSSADIAFFGGSFTGIEEPLMRHYLECAKKTREKYPSVTGLRLSTRPDYISPKILDILAEYGVTTVELGAQSLCDEVLALSGRGHTEKDVERASGLIKERKISLVLQTMTGLPGDTPERDMETARKVAELHPEAVRIYPCVVLRGTRLEQMMLSGEYKPQTVEEAVEICAELIPFYRKKGIGILRIGLHSSDLWKNSSVVGGAFHPAFGELAESEVLYREIRREIMEKPPQNGIFEWIVPKEDISKAVGQHRKNITRLENEFNIKIIIKVR